MYTYTHNIYLYFFVFVHDNEAQPSTVYVYDDDNNNANGLCHRCWIFRLNNNFIHWFITKILYFFFFFCIKILIFNKKNIIIKTKKNYQCYCVRVCVWWIISYFFLTIDLNVNKKKEQEYSNEFIRFINQSINHFRFISSSIDRSILYFFFVFLSGVWIIYLFVCELFNNKPVFFHLNQIVKK